MYDAEYKLYYLQSRYYDPSLGRFNAPDAYASTGQGILGNNMFAYCLNNPVAYSDTSGNAAKSCLSADGRIDDAPCRDASPGGGGRPQANYSSGNDYGSVADKFYVIRALKFICNTDEQVVLEAEYFAFYKGVLVIRTEGNRSGSFGVIFLTRETNDRENPKDVIRHEYGHIKQLQQLGLLSYALCIGLPSWQEWGSGSYYTKPWEITADIYGGVQSRDHSQANITRGFNYLDLSKLVGPLAWLTIN